MKKIIILLVFVLNACASMDASTDQEKLDRKARRESNQSCFNLVALDGVPFSCN